MPDPTPHRVLASCPDFSRCCESQTLSPPGLGCPLLGQVSLEVAQVCVLPSFALQVKVQENRPWGAEEWLAPGQAHCHGVQRNWEGTSPSKARPGDPSVEVGSPLWMIGKLPSQQRCLTQGTNDLNHCPIWVKWLRLKGAELKQPPEPA